MKKKKHFRITLFADATAYCQDIVLIAAKQNSLDNPSSLQALFLAAKDECKELNLIFDLSDNLFVIDVNLGNAIKPGVMIEEADMYELQDEEDIPEGVFNIH